MQGINCKYTSPEDALQLCLIIHSNYSKKSFESKLLKLIFQ